MQIQHYFTIIHIRPGMHKTHTLQSDVIGGVAYHQLSDQLQGDRVGAGGQKCACNFSQCHRLCIGHLLNPTMWFQKFCLPTKLNLQLFIILLLSLLGRLNEVVFCNYNQLVSRFCAIRDGPLQTMVLTMFLLVYYPIIFDHFPLFYTLCNYIHAFAIPVTSCNQQPF